MPTPMLPAIRLPPAARAGLVVLLLPLAAACPGERRLGPGLVDRGPATAAERYVAELGAIDLTRSGTQEFALAGLPAERFTVGLRVLDPKGAGQALYDRRPISATVRLDVLTAGGDTVIAQAAPLDQWTWSGVAGDARESFVYVRGDEPFASAAPGRGSSFDAPAGGSFKVRITVLDGDPRAGRFGVDARASGGGWKARQAG